MIERPNAPLVLGLELDSLYLKGVLVKSNKGQLSLLKSFKIKVDPEKNVPPHVKLLYKDHQETANLTSYANKSLVVTALPNSETLVRLLEIPLVKESDIDDVLDFQAESILPFPIESCIIDRMVLEKRKESTLLSILAARKEQIGQHLELWQQLKIEPEVLSCSPAALAAFSEAFCPSEKAHLLIDLGNHITTCLVVEKGKLLAAQACNLGIQNLHAAFYLDHVNGESPLQDVIELLDFSNLNKEISPELVKVLHQWRLEITKITYALLKQIRGKEIEEILFTGEGATWNHLASNLVENLGKQLIQPISKKGFSLTPTELQEIACCLGQALTAVPGAQNQINFRQKEFIYPYPWKRIKKPIVLFLMLCLALAAILFEFGHLYIENKENALKSEYGNLLTTMRKPLHEFEKSFIPKNSEKPIDAEKKSADLSSLSEAEIQLRLSALEKEIKSTPDTFPLFPNIPRVSDVLAWLSSLPHIKGERAGETPKIKMENFSYKIVKRPEQNKKRDRYQAKVELEFSASTPTYAREFHDILLAPNDFIDSQNEVNWNAERGKYRTTFFLKDKTIYPSIGKE